MPQLGCNDVHLWRVRLDVQPGPLAAVLSDDERSRAAGFRFPRHRREYVCARAALRHILAGYVGAEPGALHFRYHRQGKPMLDCGLEFNLSHGSGLALIAVATPPVGVDVERLDPDFAWEAIAAHFLSRAECEALARCPEHLRREAFFRLWTRREAYVKARGLGLGSTNSGEPIGDLVEEDGRTWLINSLVPAPAYLAAVVVQSMSFRSQFFDFVHPDLTASAMPLFAGNTI